MCKYKLPCGLCELTKDKCTESFESSDITEDNTQDISNDINRNVDRQILLEDLQSIMETRDLPVRFNNKTTSNINYELME